jgi:hypothetical protein
MNCPITWPFSFAPDPMTQRLHLASHKALPQRLSPKRSNRARSPGDFFAAQVQGVQLLTYYQLMYYHNLYNTIQIAASI